ncbi:MAG: YDG domain-containing protein, partial [Verrucomicrobiota bacterium]
MVTGVTTGTSVITYSYTNGNGCTSAVTSTVTVSAAASVPTTYTATPPAVCGGSASVLNAVSAGNNIKWYDAATAGSLLTTTGSGIDYSVTPAIDKTYYAESITMSGGTGGSQNFNYNGGVQTFTVPAGVTSLTIDAYGAQGANNGSSGGYGGRSQGTLSVSPGQVISIYVGGQSGYNGGGARGTGGSWPGVNGGGATDLRVGGTALSNRVLVAGGGGGGGSSGSSWSAYAGGAGGLTGGGGGGCCGSPMAGGGTQSGGGVAGYDCGSCGYGGTVGALGSGGTGSAACNSYGAGSGGGGGYYGGGGGATCGSGGSGGGGSSYIGGVTGGATTTGARSGDGQVQISWSSSSAVGCSSPSRKAVTVTVTPNASVGSVTGSTALCVNATTTYTANSVVLSGGTGSWSSSNTGVATVVASTGFVTAIAGGSCNIIYTITNGCGGPTSALQSVTVNALPVLASITGVLNVCQGATTALANAASPTGASWTWSSATVGVATVNSSTGVVTGVSGGTSVVTYTYTNSNGCSSSVNTTVTGTAGMAAPTSATATPATILSGSSSNIVAFSTNNDIKWYDASSGGNLLTTVTSGTSYAVSPIVTTIYYAGSSKTGSCPSVTRTPITVTVNTSPTLTTDAISSIAVTTATGGGNISSDGGSAITARGICWSILTNPTTANSKTTNATGTGAFTSSMTGLTTGTTYFVKAYATNAMGTFYGNQVSFAPFQLGTFLAVNKIFGDADFLLTNPASASSGTFSYSSGTTATATVSGNTLTVGNVGTTTITATQAAAGAYAAATSTALLTVGKANQVIGFNPLVAKIYGDGNFTVSATGGGSGNPVTFTSSVATIATCTGINGATVTILKAGTCTIYANQAGNSNYNAAPQVGQTLVVNNAAQIITFNTLSDRAFGSGTFSVSATGGASGNPVTFTSSNSLIATCSGTTVTIIGVGTCTIFANQAGNGLYAAAAQVGQSLTIIKGSQTITFDALSDKIFGGSNFEVSATGGGSGNAVTFTSSNPAVASCSGANGSTVTIVSVGTCTIYANQAGNSSYLAAAQVGQSLTIGKAAQTITFATLDARGYGDAPFTVSASGGASGNPVIFTCSDPTVATCTGTNGSTITVLGLGTCTITASQAGNASYQDATPVGRTLVVNKSGQTITFAALPDKKYNDASFLVSASGGGSGNPVTFTSSNELIATCSGTNGTIITIIGVGNCAIYADQEGNDNYHAAIRVGQTLTVGKADQVITLNKLPVGTVALNQITGPIQVSASSTSSLAVVIFLGDEIIATLNSGNELVMRAKDGTGTIVINVTQAGDAFYNPASISHTFDVVKNNQEITFGALTPLTYSSGLTSTLSATASSTLAVSYAVVSGPATVSGNTLTITGAGVVVVRASQAGNGSWNPATEVDRSLTINKATPTITFSAIDKIYGDIPFTLAATTNSSGLITYSSGTTGVATVAGNTASIKGVGISTMTASQLANNDYTAATATAILTVSMADQIISLNTLPTTVTVVNFVAAPIQVIASATSGLPVAFSLGESSVATINVSNQLVSTHHIGTVVLNVDQSGNTNFNSATRVVHTMTVTKATQTITFNALPAKIFGNGTFTLVGTASSGLDVAYTSSDTGVATVSGNTVTIVGAGSTNITASQAGNDDYEAASSVVQAITVGKADQILTLNNVPAGSYPLSTFLTTPLGITASSTAGLPVTISLGDGSPATMNCVLGTCTMTSTGAVGTMVINGSQAGNTNYNAAIVSKSFEVAKGNQTITFGALSALTYSPTLTTDLSASAGSGLDVTFTVVSGPGTLSGVNHLTVTGAGTIVIEASQAGNDNWNPATSINRSLIINKATPSITFGAMSKTYGDAPFTLEATTESSGTFSYASGTIGVATISGVTATIAGAGTSTITATLAADNNYIAGSAAALLTVGKASQTISIDAISNLLLLDYVGHPITVHATSTSGLTVTLSIPDGSAATLSGSVLTSNTTTGSVTVTASLAASANYDAAADQTVSFQVNKANQSINFDPLDDKYVGDPAFELAATSSSGLAVTCTSSDYLVATVDGLMVSLIGVGTSTMTVTQAGNIYYNAATGTQTLTVYACTNPTSGGTIGSAQSSCGSFDPSGISSSTLPSGHSGLLNYQWQASVTNSSSGFEDLDNSNQPTFDLSAITQTTWVRRLSRVGCTADWTDAAVSNVLEMKVNPDNSILLTSAAGTDSQPVCVNAAMTNITYSTTGATGATFSGLPAGVTGSWVAGVVTIGGTPTATGSFNNTVSLTGGCGSVSATGNITVNPATVGGAVAGGSTICYGQVSGELTLSGHTGTITKWQSSTNGSTWTDIAATSTTYISGILLADTWFRALVVSGVCDVVPSDATKVTVDPASVGGTVSGGTTICEGNTSALLTLAGYTGTITKWQYAESPFDTWLDISNITTTYTSDILSHTTQFRAVLKSGVCSVSYSVSTTVTVDPTSNGGTVSGGSAICTGSTSALLTLSGHVGSVVKWQYAVDPFNSWTDLVDTGTTYTSGALTETTKFRAVVKSGTCSQSFSDATTVTVNPETVSGTVNGGTTICTGETSDLLTLSGNNGTVSRWQYSTNGIFWIDITNGESTYTSGALNATTSFRAVVQSGVCPEAFSVSTTVTVTPPSVGGTVSGGTIVCTGSPSAELSLSGHTGTVVKWQYAQSPFSTWSDISNTEPTYTSGNLSKTTQFRAVVQSGLCATANSEPTTVTVSPVSDGGSVSGGTTICWGSASSQLTLAVQTGTVIYWQSSTNGTTWTEITNTLDTYTSGALTTSTYFRAMVKSGSCNATNSSATTVTVDPASVGGAVNGGSTICAGSTSGLLTLAGETGNITKWESSTDGTIWTDINNTSNTYTSVALSASTQFRAVVKSGACASVYSTATTVNVDQTTVGGTIGGGSNVCLGGRSNSLSLSGNNGEVVKWQSSEDGNSWTDIANNTAYYTSDALSVETQFRVVVKNGTCTEKYAVPATVTIDPLSVGGSVAGGSTICTGSTSGTLTLSGRVGDVVNWQSSTDGAAWFDIVNTSDTYVSGALNATTQFRAVVKSGNCSPAYSSPVTVIVSQPSVGGTITGTNITGYGGTTGTMTLGGQTGSVLNWEKKISSGSWSTVANVNLTFSETPSSAGTWLYRTQVKNGACAAVYTDPFTITVSPVLLSVIGISASNKPYDGNTTASISGTAQINGVIGTEDVVLGGTATAVFDTKDAGDGKTVQVSGYTISGTKVANYTLVQPTLAANITQKALTVSGVTADNKTYDRNTTATITSTGYTLNNIVGADPVTLDASGYAANFDNSDKGNGKRVTVSGLTLSGAKAANYMLTQPTGLTANITARQLTVLGAAAENKVYDTNNSAVISGATLDGVIEPDVVILVNGTSGVFAQTGIGNGIAVSSSPMSITGANSSNYSLLQPAGLSANITAKTLTVSGATAQNKVYNGNNTAVISGAVLVGKLGSDAVTLNNSTLGSFAQTGVGTNIAVSTLPMTIAGAQAGNYLLIQPTGLQADITPKELTVSGTFTVAGKVYNGNATALIAANNLVLQTIESGDVITLNAVAVFSDQNIGVAKTVSLTGSSLAGVNTENYTLSLVGAPTATANIAARVLTIGGSFTANNKIYDRSAAATFATNTLFLQNIVGAEDVTLNAFIGFANKLIGTGKAITLDGSILAGADKGNYTLSLAGASSTTGDISAKSLTVSGATAQNKVYDGTLTAVISGATLVGVVNLDDVTFGNYSSGNFAQSNIGNDITVSTLPMTITGADIGNYTLAQPSGLKANITPACTNPANGGSIAANQIGCAPFQPEVITSSTLPTGHTGTLVYKWQHSVTNSLEGFTDIASSNDATLDPGALSQTTWFKRIATVDCMGSWSGAKESNVIQITVNPQGQVNSISDQILCNSSGTSTVAFVTVNPGGATTYAWANNDDGIGLLGSGTGNIASFTAINAGTTPVTSSIEVTPTFTNGGVSCAGPTKTFNITVNPTAEVDQPANQVLCNGSATTAINFTTQSTGGTTTYAWTNSDTSIGLLDSGAGSIASFTAINSGTAPVTATIVVTSTFANGGVSCAGIAKTFTITVNPTAEVDQPASQVLCNGSATTAVSFTTSGTGGTVTYAWTNSDTSIGLAASGTGDIGSFTAINTGTAPATASIVVTPAFANGGVSCTGPAKTFTITVNPIAQVNAISGQVLCNGSNTSAVTFATGSTGGTTTYAWTNSDTSIGLAGSGTGNIASFAAVNTGNAPVTASIVV